MNNEFDRYEIERVMRLYSNDLLSAFDFLSKADESEKRNAISRAMSMLADIDYINKVAEQIREQVKDCQRKLSDNHPKTL